MRRFENCRMSCSTCLQSRGMKNYIGYLKAEGPESYASQSVLPVPMPDPMPEWPQGIHYFHARMATRMGGFKIISLPDPMPEWPQELIIFCGGSVTSMGEAPAFVVVDDFNGTFCVCQPKGIKTTDHIGK